MERDRERHTPCPQGTLGTLAGPSAGTPGSIHQKGACGRAPGGPQPPGSCTHSHHAIRENRKQVWKSCLPTIGAHSSQRGRSLECPWTEEGPTVGPNPSTGM